MQDLGQKIDQHDAVLTRILKRIEDFNKNLGELTEAQTKIYTSLESINKNNNRILEKIEINIPEYEKKLTKLLNYHNEKTSDMVNSTKDSFNIIYNDLNDLYKKIEASEKQLLIKEKNLYDMVVIKYPESFKSIQEGLAGVIKEIEINFNKHTSDELEKFSDTYSSFLTEFDKVMTTQESKFKRIIEKFKFQSKKKEK